MRTFLFKAKRIDNGEWVVGDLEHNWKHIPKWVDGKEINPETICQFTDLIDSDDECIYEGDIVELYDKNSGVKWRAVVVFGNPYCEYSWGWNLKYIGRKPCVNTDILCWVEMEETGAFCKIIGNVFDNPELLKNENLSNKGIENIEKGDKVKCLNCNKEIQVGKETFVFDENGEYIVCPHCKKGYDVQVYHLKGEKL